MSEIRDVTDADGRRYKLGRLLGEGGQGEVYPVEGQPLVVKLLRVRASDQSYDRLRRQLEFVKRLSLTEVPIARPLVMLAPPNVGYVMERMTGMEPLGKLFPPWRCANRIEWYTDTGSLERRLRLLARCAEAIGQLHGKGLAYGDVSPNNVFVSAAAEEDQVWLIDADNLRYQSSPGLTVPHTPGYGAPEVVSRKSGITSLTDAHSFAVMAFEALALVHPFYGDIIETGEPELEEQARAGAFPWIDHPEDDRNRSSRGIPRDIVLSDRLQELATKAFIDGLHNPRCRPTTGEWARRLFTAADLTLKCPVCHGSFYFKRESCPWCDAARPSYLMLILRACVPQPDQKRLYSGLLSALAVTIPNRVYLTARLMEGHIADRIDPPRLEIEITESGVITIRSLDGEKYQIVSGDGTGRDWISGALRRFPESWHIHLGPPDQVHRVLSFQRPKGIQK